jgi:phosphate transport system permease protein
MTETLNSRADLAASSAHPRDRATKRFRASDRFFYRLTRSAATIVLLTFAGALIFLIKGSTPAFRAFGWRFLTTPVWNPPAEKFSAGAAIFGTVVTSAIAIAIAAPVGVGIAIFLTEFCPRFLRRPVGIAVELLAGIPSIIYGLWGLLVFAPFMRRFVEPALIAIFGGVPALSSLFAGPPLGVGVLTASIVLAIMALPLVASVLKDVFETAPRRLREQAYAIGCTRREVAGSFVIPYTRLAVAGGVMLGLGRALGETMAVVFVIGAAHRISASLLAPGTTIAATIANDFPEAAGDLYTSSLIALGLILFAITFVVLALAKLMLMRLEARAGA